MHANTYFSSFKNIANAQKATDHLCKAKDWQQEFVDRHQFQAAMAYQYIM